jgi:hypothetical protein
MIERRCHEIHPLFLRYFAILIRIHQQEQRLDLRIAKQLLALRARVASRAVRRRPAYRQERDKENRDYNCTAASHKRLPLRLERPSSFFD